MVSSFISLTIKASKNLIIIIETSAEIKTTKITLMECQNYYYIHLHLARVEKKQDNRHSYVYTK